MSFHLLLLLNTAATEQARMGKSEALLGGEDLVELLDVEHRVKPLLRLQLAQAVEQVENRLLSYLMKPMLGGQQFVVGNVGEDIALAERRHHWMCDKVSTDLNLGNIPKILFI